MEAKLLPEIEKFEVKFHATASEYFRIWIVNLVLTILTFGIYSAWAKVRRLKYLYGNVEIAGARLDYHADPVKILWGRIVIGILFLGYAAGGYIWTYLPLISFLLFAAAFPLLVVRALRFQLANTSYRNLRFGFEKDYKASYKTYFKATLFSVLTFGLGIPYAMFLKSDFRMNRIQFGNLKFQFHAKPGQFYSLYIKSLWPAVVAFGIYLAAGAVLVYGAKVIPEYMGLVTNVVVVPAILTFYLALISVMGLIRARQMNLLGNQTNLESIRFQVSLKPNQLVQIYITNFLACLFTFGLAIPWALIRAMKYRLDHTSLIAPQGALERINASLHSGTDNAKADAAADFWDVDLGL